MGNRQGMVLSPGYFRFLVFYFFYHVFVLFCFVLFCKFYQFIYLLYVLCLPASCSFGWLLIEASEEGWVLVYGWLCSFI